MKKQQANSAAIYCRLSRDDGGDAESNSIGTQRAMLQRYAKEHGFTVFDEYVDDGWSGTQFDRPELKRMLADIEDGKIGIVLCKDLSRFGRNNALVAYYTEVVFPDNDVRFIAVNDAIDTALGDSGGNAVMPFMSVVNEYYARDISKKVRSAIRTMALSGEHCSGSVPIGYLKDPDNPRRNRSQTSHARGKGKQGSRQRSERQVVHGNLTKTHGSRGTHQRNDPRPRG